MLEKEIQNVCYEIIKMLKTELFCNRKKLIDNIPLLESFSYFNPVIPKMILDGCLIKLHDMDIIETYTTSGVDFFKLTKKFKRNENIKNILINT